MSLLVSWSVIFAAGLVSLRADINLPTAPPPQPIAQTVQVAIGGSVDIPLRGVSRSGQQLSFLIRSQPQLGTLSSVVVNDRNSAVVRYRHDVNQGAGADRFRYAVQVPGSGVSTPAEVIIRVVDKPPRFEAPSILEFQPVAVGKTRTKVFALRNDGGGVVAGKMELPEPWVFTDGDGAYRLAENESVEIAVTFAPQKEGRATGEARFSHTSTLTMRLTGEAFLPVEAPLGVLQFAAAAEGLERGAILRLRNRTEETQFVDVNAPKELGGPREVTIEGLAEVEVPLKTIPEFLGSLEGSIPIVNDGVEFSVPFRLFSAPAKLVYGDSEPVIDFGSVMLGRSVRQTISVKNVGGAEAQLRADLPEGISTKPLIGSEVLGPGVERVFDITFVADPVGAFEEPLTVNDGGGAKLELTVRATVEVDPRLPQVTTLGVGNQGDQKAAKTPSSPVASAPAAAFAPVEEIRILEITKHEVKIEWDNPSKRIIGYDLLERQFKFHDDGRSEVVWVPMKNAVLEMGEKTSSLKMRKLKPGQQVALQIVGFDGKGMRTAPWMPFVFESMYSDPIHIPWIPIGIVIVIVCVYFLRRERLRQKQELDAEFRRFSEKK